MFAKVPIFRVFGPQRVKESITIPEKTNICFLLKIRLEISCDLNMIQIIKIFIISMI